ncbi:hypothetical protein VKI21_07080 [Cyanobacterium aponinum UTEX 3222]|uniref:Uncharacterized protein n=2 Tax=Cyanobacterium aponinum TaxID=379064 RepID=K9Z8B2_CYAAP|nr:MULTISPECIES: hypothetical protein [Cyanobacterium]WRL43440.1 hypothetical protein VKI21_07080 [Cyanobacterium aponinum UTEX 3222]AFZ54613.1 hypothetical protein Cyan10605_2533 [Cyanobacterium aponinum PCC 10605]MBD2394622.1 hypothetical protein [Cyanobacterium aponinum FACHB-4101]PHV63870.1 hypothetical protein CSQ80_03425 [Cyanobacterium aponinum IPPAS B-1201]WPF87987.1 hypothetical protein SAY89_14465 [Cyanobacterium aponinum AL20115]
MKVWLVSFFILFALTQFIMWLKNFFMPLPLYIFGGAFLAIASNYDQNISKFISHKTQTFFGSKLDD